MRDMLDAARAYYIETEDAGMAEVERILSLEDEDLENMVHGKSDTETAS
jgi:phosphate:Na+ symporter